MQLKIIQQRPPLAMHALAQQLYNFYLLVFFVVLYAVVPPPYNHICPYTPHQGYQQHGYSQLGYSPPQRRYYLAPAAPSISAVQYQQQTANQPTVICQPALIRQATLIRKPTVIHQSTVNCNDQSESKPQINHGLHLFITLFIFPPWIFVWIVLCMEAQSLTETEQISQLI